MTHIKTLLVAALAAMSFCVTKAQTTNEAALENIMTRTSIRKFEARPVEQEKIERLLRAGMAAPTADDRQPWHFVVLKDKKDIDTYAATNARHADDIRATPLFIFVCADTTRMSDGMGRELWIQDCSAVSENILLAAHAMRLGAVWTTVWPIERKVKGISRALRLPGNLIPLNAICIGYPAETHAPKDKWDEKKITWGLGE